MEKFKKRLRRWFKLRFAVVYPLCIWAVFSANTSDDSIMLGIWFMFAGMGIRVWSNGYAVKLDKLTVSGPYALVRNPLYVGTGLIFVGFVMMLQLYIVGAAFLLAALFIYRKTIREEEQMLEDKFHEAYVDYKTAVPALIPRFALYGGGEKWPFSWYRLWKSQEYKVVLWGIFIVIAFHLKEELVLEREVIDAKILMFMGFAVMIGMLDIVGEVFRKRHKTTSEM